VLVGFNYPWPGNRYISIGPNLSPRGDPQPWRGNNLLMRNLKTLQRAGISVVRIWLMGDGANYDGRARFGFDNKRGYFWDFEPPAHVDPAFIDDFRALLSIFADAEMQIIPVLVDFGFFDEPPQRAWPPPTGEWTPTNGGYPRGRRTVATVEAYRKTFISGTVEPLIQVATEDRFKPWVYAIDVCNEPYWCVAPITGGLFGRAVDVASMTAFLVDCVAAVKRANLPSTIGHRYLGDIAGLFKAAVVEKPQYHYYAKLPYDLLQSPESKLAPFVGEFGSVTPGEIETFRSRYINVDNLSLTANRWLSAFGGADGKPEKILPLRLAFLANQGCPLAMLWPDRPDFIGNDVTRDELKLTRVKLDSITGMRFSRGMHVPL
jgi:hypothetical protein